MLDDKNNFTDISNDERYAKVSNLGIYELRGLARALGVPSPTTKKRDYLVSAIIDKLDSNNIELVQKAGKGRPFKKMEGIDNILNLIGEQAVKPQDKIKEFTYDDLVVLAQEIPVFEKFSLEEYDVKGVIRAVKNSSYFIDIEKEGTVFIPENITGQYNLKNGDFIEGYAKNINGKKQYQMTKIIAVNKIEIDEYFPKEENLSEKKFPDKIINIQDKELLVGGRNALIINEPIFLNTQNIKFLTSNFEEFDDVIFLGLNLCSEDKILLNSLNKRVFQFTSEYGRDNLSKNFDCIIDAINLCDRLVLNGEKCLFIVYDVMNILTSLDIYFSNSDAPMKMGHLTQSCIILEKLISLAGCYSDGKSCSEILFCNDLDMTDLFIRNCVIKVSKRIN